jgi:hypothetical protein
MDLTITRATTSLQINTLRIAKMQPVDGEVLQTGFDFPSSTLARSALESRRISLQYY